MENTSSYTKHVLDDIAEDKLDFVQLVDVSLAAATKVALSMIEMLK